MVLNFEWDEEKAEANLKDHSADEQRYIDIGSSDRGRGLVVVYGARDEYTNHQLSQADAHRAETL